MRAWVSLRLAIILCLPLAACALAGPARAAGLDSLQRGIQQYERAEFEDAQRLLLEAINSGYLEPRSLSRAYAYLGLIYLAGDQDSYAEDAFARAKGQDPGFSPDPALFPPEAIGLFQRARPQGQPVRPLTPSAPAPSPAPPSQPARPVVQAPPAPPEQRPPAGEAATAYVIDIAREDITIDQGSSQGVRIGDRFEIIETRAIVHPVTGNKLHSRRQVAVVMVVEVQADLSLAKFVSGRLDLLAPGLEARSLTGQAAPQAKPASQRKPGSETRIMVMPPELQLLSGDSYADRSSFQAAQVAQALKAFPRMDACLPDPGSLEGLAQTRPSSLAGVMEQLEADAVLFWSVSSGENETNHLTLRYDLYLRGNDRPSVQEKEMASAVKMQRQYGPFIAQGIAETLKLDK